MPREDRWIYFDFEEVYKAIYALSVQKQLKKPPIGLITAVAETPGDVNTIVFQFANPQENTVGAREYSRDFLAAAVMLYCRTLRIPLPKSATKQVEISKGQVVLRVQVGMAAAAPPQQQTAT